MRARRVVAGQEAAEVERRLRVLRAEVAHLDGALAAFGVNEGPRALGTPPRPPHDPAVKGEMADIVLDALRAAPDPISTVRLTQVVLTARRIDKTDRALAISVRKRTLSCLNRLRRNGLVRSEARPGNLVVWWSV